MNITHLTVGFPFTEQLNKLRDQSIRNGFNYINLGRNKKVGEVNYYTKLELMHEILQSATFRDDDIILFTDGYDVCIMDDAKTILKKFNNMNCDLLFNAEKGFWPPVDQIPSYGDIDRNIVKEYFDGLSNTYKKHLNSGVYIGYVKCIKKMMDFCTSAYAETGVWDDQALSQFFMYSEKDFVVKIDAQDEVFCTLALTEQDLEIDGLFVRNKYTGFFPSILHANGYKNHIKGYNNLNFLQDQANTLFKIYIVKNEHGYLSCSNLDSTFSFSRDSDNFVYLVQKRSGECAFVANSGKFVTFHEDKHIELLQKNILPWETVYIREGKYFSHHNYNVFEIFENNKGFKIELIEFGCFEHMTDVVLNLLVNI